VKEQLQSRLKALHAEYEAGEKMLADTETKQANIRATLLRISGAIQVLEEELAKASGDGRATGLEQQSVAEATAAGRGVPGGAS
jgi:hypothetical protein